MSQRIRQVNYINTIIKVDNKYFNKFNCKIIDILLKEINITFSMILIMLSISIILMKTTTIYSIIINKNKFSKILFLNKNESSNHLKLLKKLVYSNDFICI